MATLKLHYDGWLALPADLRRKLGLASGDRLEAELAGGAIVLRPAAKKGRRPERREEKAAIEPLIADAGELASTSAPRKAPGRPRKAALAPESGPAALPVVGVGPSKLRKKADLPPKAAPADPTAPPAEPVGRTRGDAGSQPVERRPFRNVEVRKLGPGRGHTRPRGFHP